jgi:hypothetical protein
MNVYHESIVTPQENLITTSYSKTLHYKDSQLIQIQCQKCNDIKTTQYGWHFRAQWFKNKKPYWCTKCTQKNWIEAGHKAVTGKSHPNKGKTYEQIHGIKEAKRIKKLVARHGKNNAQFGKPAYNGSGNGWSGYYKGKYFRSLLELSFIVNFLEKNNLTYESAEQIKYAIPYINIEKKKRNYFADYIVNNTLIEVKPKLAAMWRSNICKFRAAKKWCKKNNMDFKIYDHTMFEQLKDKQLKKMYEEGIIVWIDRYEKKFKEKYYGGK